MNALSRSWSRPDIRTGRALLTTLLLLLGAAAPAAARPLHTTPPRLADPLTGTVTDADGAPLAGARVAVVELGRAVLTDDAGRFSFPGLRAGDYTLEVRRPGYAVRLVEIEVPSAPVTVALRTQPLPVDAVTVTATRGALSPLHSPLPGGAVGREALEREQSISLAHTLQRLPGVRTLSTGTEIGKPVIRGLSGSRVLVLSQGLRLEDYAWSDEDAPSVDAALVDRVEVVRGPGAVLYGPDAVGGVVNVIPRPLPYAVDGAPVLRGEVELGGASNNRQLDVIARGEGARGPWGWRAAAAGRLAEALHTPDGELENTGFGAFDGDAAIARRGDWGSVTARFVHYGGEFKLLEEDEPAPAPGGEEEGGPERKLGDDRLQLLGSFPLGDLRLETRFQGQRHHLIELEDQPAATPGTPVTEVPVFDLLLNTGLGEVLVHHGAGTGISGTFGATGEIRSSTSSGVIPLIPDASTASAGVFGLERWERGPVTVLAGARADHVAIDPRGDRASRSFDAVSWSAGTAIRLVPGLALTGNVGRAWRPPTLFELYAAGPRLGEARYEIGRDDLVAERALDLDAGVRWEWAGVRGEVAAFRNRFDHFLFVQPTDSVQDGYRVFLYDQADATLQGGEASLQVEPLDFLALAARGEYVRGTNEERHEPLPLMPPARITAEAELHGPVARWGTTGFFGLEVEHVAAPERLNPFDIPVDAYTLLNARAGMTGTLHGHEVRADLRVHNALDTSYRDFLSRYKAFALNPGRDMALSVRVGL